MRLAKKLTAVCLMLVMLFSLVALASAENTYDILVKTDKENRTYEAYQIFGGTVQNIDGELVLVDLTWGASTTEETQKQLSVWYSNTYDVDNDEPPEIYPAYDVAKALAEVDGKTMGGLFDPDWRGSDFVASASTLDTVAGGYVLTVEEAGYYLICEKKDSQDGQHTSTTWFLLQTTNPDETTVLEPKEPQDPTVDKFVTDEESFVSENYGWDEREYAELGETVYFCLEANFPFNYVDETGWTAHSFDDYEVYPFTFSDLHPAGLTLNQDSFKVYTNGYFGEEVDSSLYTVELIAGSDGGYRINVHFDDLSEIVAKRAPDGDAVEQFPVVLESLQVIYTATVNKNALVPEGTDWEEDDSTTGNINSVYATYPNDPNYPDEEDGKTPSAEAEVFTFMLEVNKVDENGAPLDGAKFVLYDEGEDLYLVYDLENEILEWVDDVNAATVFTSSTTTDEEGNVVTAGYFKIKGLTNSENYELVEIEAPLGYNRLESSVYFPIGVEDSTNANVTVVNEKGLVLPSTGGIGTTVLYVVGAILLIGGGILVFAKRRAQD